MLEIIITLVGVGIALGCVIYAKKSLRIQRKSSVQEEGRFSRNTYHHHLKFILHHIHSTTSYSPHDEYGRGIAKPTYSYHDSIRAHSNVVGKFIEQHLYTYQKLTGSTDLYDLYEKINTHLSNPDRLVALASAENHERIKEFNDKFHDFSLAAQQNGNLSYFGACDDCIDYVTDKKLKIESKKLLKDISD